jgi:hypothetical protein
MTGVRGELKSPRRLCWGQSDIEFQEDNQDEGCWDIGSPSKTGLGL